MKVVACIIARMVSQRLPVKVLRDLSPGTSMIEFLIQRLQQVEELDAIYLCTSTSPLDDILEDVALRNNIQLYRGSEDAVIERMIDVGEQEQADAVIRITGDNPFTAIEYLPQQIRFLKDYQLDYTRIVDVPIGATAEVISFSALKDCYAKMDPSVSEYLMLFLFEPNTYQCGILKVLKEDYSEYSVTVDTLDDLVRSKRLLENLKTGIHVKLKEIVNAYAGDTKGHYPAKRFGVSGNVKLPYGKTVSFASFMEDMERRKANAKLLKLYD